MYNKLAWGQKVLIIEIDGQVLDEPIAGVVENESAWTQDRYWVEYEQGMGGIWSNRSELKIN